jgi:hypothetical protein
MANEKKKLNKSNKNYTNSLAAYNCNSCSQFGCGGTPTNYSSNQELGRTLQLPYW